MDHEIRILSISEDLQFQLVETILAPDAPLLLKGDIVAHCDIASQVVMYDWRTGSSFKFVEADEGVAFDQCNEVIMGVGHVGIIRQRTVRIFSLQTLKLVFCLSFGWTDGISANFSTNSSASQDAFMHILARTECENPWSFHKHTIDLYRFDLNTLQLENVRTISARRGPLRCPALKLGACGTAIWIQPKNTSATGLTVLGSVVATEDSELEGVVFMAPNGVTKTLLVNREVSNWTCFDYDEATGRLAMGSGYGLVMLLHI